MILVYIFGAISVFISCFGMEGRGTWSRHIASVGGILWMISVIAGFYFLGLTQGLLFLLGTFVLGAILTKVFRLILNPHGH